MKIFILLFVVFGIVFAETKLIRQNAVDKTVVLQIRQGWNLVSLPGYQAYFATTFFDVKNVDRILSYNKFINKWMGYYSSNEAHFSSLVLTPGVGYWIKGNYDFNIAISSDYKTSVTNLTDDEFAKEILDEQNKGSVVVAGVTWMKAVFRNLRFEEAKEECRKNNARLPTVEELYIFYKNTIISSEYFNGEHIYYWTSSQSSIYRKWIIDFGTGNRALQHIDTYNSARCLLY
jgi:hypothetical protein